MEQRSDALKGRSVPVLVSVSEAARVVGLRQQHQALELSRYDGHNRRPIASSLKHLSHRRRRRVSRMRLRATVSTRPVYDSDAVMAVA